MDESLRALLDDLYRDGLHHDRAQADWLARRRNLEPDAAELLWVIIRAMAARQVVELRTADGGAVLAELPDGGADVVFLDSERPEYPKWWPHPLRVLRPGGLLAVDNVLSHPDEVAPLLEIIEAEPALTATVVPVGKGELLAVKSVS